MPKQIRLPIRARPSPSTSRSTHASVPIGQTRFATIEFKQGDKVLRFPVTLVRGRPDVNIAKGVRPGEHRPRHTTTNCTITLKNTTFNSAEVDFFDQLPDQLRLLPQTVCATVWGNSVPTRAWPAHSRRSWTIAATNDSPAGYLPPHLRYCADRRCGDETITNFNVPAFTYAGKSRTRLGIEQRLTLSWAAARAPTSTSSTRCSQRPATEQRAGAVLD